MGKVIALFAEEEVPQNFPAESYPYEPLIVIFNNKKLEKKTSSKNNSEDFDQMKKKEKTKRFRK